MKRVMAAACFLMLATPVWAADAPKSVRIDDNDVYPESMDAANGTLYIGSSRKGIIYRALPGSAYAEPWLQPPQGFGSLGVLADAPSNTLWVCYNGGSGATSTSSLRSFNLKTGAAKGVYPFPGTGTLCNDIALHRGAAYATDTRKGRVLKLAKGATQLTDWWTAPAGDTNMDGIAFAPDGKLYVNSYSSNHVLRVDINPDGSAGKGTVLATSIPIAQPDGMRFAPNGKMLLIEANLFPDNPNVKLGRVDQVTIHGDKAEVNVLQDGFEVPAGVTTMGGKIYVLQTKFDYQRRPELKGKDPGPFTAEAVSQH